MPNPRVIFMGTPDFAVPSLQTLASRTDIDLCLVVTQPDRPAGRGKKLVAPPVKTVSEELGLPILQTDSLRHAEVKAQIIAAQPDLVVVAAFGMILGKWILELPTHGCVNLHASLLPKYRGASPISAAILAGEDVSGVTLMQMDRGLDTGDMLATIEVPIESEDTTESLTPKLAAAAATLLEARLTDLLHGEIEAVPQPEGATETAQLTKDDGRVEWSQPAERIERQVRAMWSWPRAWTQLPSGDRMQIHAVQHVSETELAAGEIAIRDKRVYVGAEHGEIELVRVQLPGGRPLDGNALVQKLSPFEGESLQ